MNHPTRSSDLSRAAAALVFLVLALGLAPELRAEGAPGIQVIYVVRHAEKAAEPAADPPLSEIGQVRAQELVRMLGRSGVQGFYATKTERSRQTLAPLAQEVGLLLTEMEPEDPYGIAARILQDGIPVAITAGHGDTVGPILEGLGVEPPTEHVRWDDLFMVIRAPDQEPCLHWMKYGPPVEE